MISIVRYRGFIWRRAWMDVRHRFAGTGAGVLWNVLQPLATISLYSVIFTTLMSAQIPELQNKGPLAFTLHLCAGMLPWIAFSECIARGANALTANAQFLKKLAVPEYLFFAETAVSTGIGLAISFSILLVFSMLSGNMPVIQWLALPVPLFCFLWLAYAFAVLGGSLRVFFPDIKELLPVILQIAMWAAPIVYAASIVPNWLQRVIVWHPIFPALTATRELFLLERWPTSETWIAMVAWPVFVTIFAHLVLLKLRPEIRDVI